MRPHYNVSNSKMLSSNACFDNPCPLFMLYNELQIQVHNRYELYTARYLESSCCRLWRFCLKQFSPTHKSLMWCHFSFSMNEFVRPTPGQEMQRIVKLVPLWKLSHIAHPVWQVRVPYDLFMFNFILMSIEGRLDRYITSLSPLWPLKLKPFQTTG